MSVGVIVMCALQWVVAPSWVIPCLVQFLRQAPDRTTLHRTIRYGKCLLSGSDDHSKIRSRELEDFHDALGLFPHITSQSLPPFITLRFWWCYFLLITAHLSSYGSVVPSLGTEVSRARRRCASEPSDTARAP